MGFFLNHAWLSQEFSVLFYFIFEQKLSLCGMNGQELFRLVHGDGTIHSITMHKTNDGSITMKGTCCQHQPRATPMQKSFPPRRPALMIASVI